MLQWFLDNFPPITQPKVKGYCEETRKYQFNLGLSSIGAAMSRRIQILLPLLAFFWVATLGAHEYTPCVNGSADFYSCLDIDLQRRLHIEHMGGTPGSSAGSDIWGWTDSGSGREFAIMTLNDATAFVEITDPRFPVYLGSLATHAATVNVWRDAKTYADHAFIVADGVTDHGMQIFDLSQLLTVVSPPVTFTETAHHPGFSKAHNIVINEDSARAYAVGTEQCSGGLYIMDISTPTSPVNTGCFSSDGYTHDAQCLIYNGPDADHQGKEICLNSNEDTLTIVDVTTSASPVQLSRTGYSGAAYTHQGWLLEGHRYYLMDDELDEQGSGHNTKTRIWDLADLDNPVNIGEYIAGVAAIDHNLYTKDGYAYLANYRSGLRVLDLSDIANANLSEVAFFDTFPSDDNASFAGAWSVYPYFESGNVIVSDIQGGLFVLKPTNLCGGRSGPTGMAAAAAGDNQIDLSWNDDAELGETYKVYRSLGGCVDPQWELIAEDVSTNSFSDTSASGGIVNGYAVSISSEPGPCESAKSSCDSATTTGACTAAPLFDGILSAESAGTSKCALDIGWGAASPFCGPSASYSVYRSEVPGFTPEVANRVVQGVSGTAWNDPGVLAETEYFYVVRATDTTNGVEENNVFERNASPDGPPTDGNWVSGAEIGDPTMSTSTNSLDEVLRHAGWHLSTDRQRTGDRSYFSEYTNNLCTQLGSPELTLTGGESPVLSFWTVYDVETEAGGQAWDGGVVEVSSNGSSWSLLPLAPGYPTVFRSSSDACGFDTSSPCFAGTNLTWTEYTADLSAFSGGSLYLRFSFSTDGGVTQEGWYVDDIAISHTQVPGQCNVEDSIFDDGFESGDTAAWSSSTP